jgi:hypothetical protein
MVREGSSIGDEVPGTPTVAAQSLSVPARDGGGMSN